MTTALHGWLNLPVKVVLQSTLSTTLQGTLFHVDDAGIVLETSASKQFVPFAAILHVELCDALELQPTVVNEAFWRLRD